jgi:hypothetical protein
LANYKYFNMDETIHNALVFFETKLLNWIYSFHFFNKYKIYLVLLEWFRARIHLTKLK